MVAGVAGALGFGLLIRRTTDEALRAQQLSDRLGTNVDAFSRLSRVMARSGIQMGQTATMVQRMMRRAVEAKEGNERLAEAFADLGIDVEEFIQLDPVEAFIQLGRALSGVENDAERLRKAFQILDSEGVQALQANLNNLRQDMATTTGITDSQARSVTRLAEQWDKFKDAISGAFLAIGERTGAFEVLSRVMEGLTRLVQNPAPFVEHMQNRTRSLLESFRGVGRPFGAAMELLRPLPPPDTSIQTGFFGGSKELIGGDLTTTNQILRQIQRNTQEPRGAVAQ